MGQQIAVSCFDAEIAQAQTWSSADAVRILDDIRRAVADRPDDARAAASRLLNLLSMPAASAPRARGGLAPWQKRKIDRYVRDHLTQALPVEQLADQVSLSPSYFHHAFKATFGLSPHAFVTTLRIAAVQEMMRATKEPLSQIALACGFADQSHLCKIFRREMGETPSAWRRSHAADAQIEAAQFAPGHPTSFAAASDALSHFGKGAHATALSTPR